MKNTFFIKFVIAFAFFSIVMVTGSTVTAQEVLLDKMEKCGDLICYPTFKDANAFYYLPDQPRLAYKDGKPQFSFLKYARTRETGKAGIGRAEGGGIIHFLVTYGASKARVKAAEKELQERHPDAKIVGPIVYRRGSFALITSFKEGNTTTTRTVAVGKAPLMEGQKAAVSMAVTREGAELLWESFKSDTPDISLVFDMEFAGIRNPYEATIIADWSRVSQSQSLKAGVKYAWFGADIDMLFQELRQTQAVKIVTKGENAQLDKIVEAAHNKLLNVMFDPVPSPELTQAAADNSYNNLNQAVQMLRNAAQSRSSSSSSSGSRSSSAITPYPHQTGTFLWAAMMNLIAANAYADPPADTERINQVIDRGYGLYDQGNYSSAIATFREALELYSQIPNPPAAERGMLHYRIGDAYTEMRQYENAEQSYLRAADIYGRTSEDGRNAVADAANARSLASGSGESSDSGEQARQAFNEALELARAERCEEAIPIFQEAERLGYRRPGSDHPEGRLPHNIGACYYRLENYQQAIDHFEEALRRYTNEEQELVQDTEEAIRHAREMLGNQAGGGATSEVSGGEDAPAESASDAYNRACRLYEEARTGGFTPQAMRAALGAYERYQQAHSPSGSRAEEVSGRIRMLRSRLEASGEPSRAATTGTGSSPSTGFLPNPFDASTSSSTASGGASASASRSTASTSSSSSSTPTVSASSSSSSSSPSTSAAATRSTGTRTARPGSGSSAASQRSNGTPGFSLVASYKLRKLKTSGRLEYEMNHYSNETQAFAMAENIGAIYKKYGNDPSVFRAVTIDDPVFKQREIMVTLDGQDTATFTKYLNFVTVKMKKRHQAGEVTTGEIVITSETFNTSGNHFSMAYGWKNDADRTKWLDYEYQATWSFHGGVEIRSPWTKTDSPMLALSPPHRYRSVSIEGDGDILSDAEVRHAVITLLCKIGDRYIPQQVTIRNNSPAPTLLLEIPEDPDNPDTKVDITWYLTKNRKRTSVQTKLEGDIIYWDELPKGGV